MAPLLPKLRGYFAEFLDQVSLLRLGILYPPTCVGLRYGLLLVVLAFLGSLSCNTVRHKASPQNSITWLQFGKRPLHFAGAEILISFPSPTPIGLGLGPD